MAETEAVYWRLPPGLKGRVEARAADRGLSANAMAVELLEGALEPPRPPKDWPSSAPSAFRGGRPMDIRVGDTIEGEPVTASDLRLPARPDPR